jgi:hypothetical protein
VGLLDLCGAIFVRDRRSTNANDGSCGLFVPLVVSRHACYNSLSFPREYSVEDTWDIT